MKLGYKLGITSKLLLVVTSIIVIAIGSVVYIASDLYLEESINRIQVNNKDSVLNASVKIKSNLEDVTAKMKLMAQVVNDGGYQSEQTKTTVHRILSGFDSFLSFYIYKKSKKGEVELYFSSVLDTSLSEYDIDKRQLEELPLKEILEVTGGTANEVIVINSAKQLNRPILSVGFVSTTKDQQEWLFRAEIRQSTLSSALPEYKEITSYVVAANGEVLAHSSPVESHKIYQGLKVSDQPIVQHLLQSKFNNHQMEYVTSSNEPVLGAYRKLDLAGLSVVAQVPKSKALATIRQVQYRSFLVMLIIVCFAFFINYSFSHSLTEPLRRLYLATSKIIEGNYDVSLKKTSSDELGALTLAFNDMALGLKEREKIKTAFNKFHSKEIAAKLLSGEIKLGGERKIATVLFSDIRGFTSMSENMSPDEVVQLLNEYLTGMVKIIDKWHGIVDKYIGDAIMAVWGTPETKPDDAYNAVMASLEMRDFMKTFNEKRVLEGKSELKIGIGLHTGEVVAGNIGSEERLEYTCIGDTVNQASRIEAATKVFGADILVSDATQILIEKKKVVCGPQLKVQVKGKANHLRVCRVIGYMNESGMQTTLSADVIATIQNQVAPEFLSEEEKVESLEKTVVNMPSPATYHVIADPLTGAKTGPFSLEQIKVKMAHGDFDPRLALICNEGETEMKPMIGFLGVDRRNSKPPTSPPKQSVTEDVQRSSFANEWFIYGPKGESMGPYSFDDIKKALEAGHITRSTFIWKTGFDDWVHLHEVDEFNRRAG